jgi:hypothetical protein
MAAVLPQTLEICVTITELPEVLVSPGRLEQATLLGLMLVMVPVVVQPVEQLTLVVQFPTPPQPPTPEATELSPYRLTP